MLGSAKSITTTSGCSFAAASHRFVAVARFADHADRRIVFQHAAKAAPHQAVVVHQQDGDGQLQAWVSCTRSGHGQPHQRAAAIGAPEIRPGRSPAPRVRASRPVPFPDRLRARNPTPSILHFEHDVVGQIAQGAPRRVRRLGMPRDVVQRLLHDAVKMDARRRDRVRGWRPFSRIGSAMPVCFSKAGR